MMFVIYLHCFIKNNLSPDLDPHIKLIRSRYVGHLFPDARDCRIAWVMVAAVARWDTPISQSCLMSAVAVSHYMHQSMCARR